MKAIVFFLGFVYECLLTDITIALQCGKRMSDCCSGYMYDKDKATCVECPAGYHGPHCNESCPFPSYGVLCRLRCTCGIGYCHNAYGCYIKKTTGMASTITSSPKRNILATLKNNNPKNETSMSTLVSKMTGVIGTEFHVVKDFPIRGMVMIVNNGVYVNHIYAVTSKDVNYQTDVPLVLLEKTVTNSVHIHSMVLAAKRAACVQNNAVTFLQAVHLQRQLLRIKNHTRRILSAQMIPIHTPQKVMM
uniref:Uncharacterized protein n=1 Tax=Magallana gigas TaxID=29159 RepID=A0A8W8MN87_MAGGI